MVQHSPLNKCAEQFKISSYNALCDGKALTYNNFLGTTCYGPSLLTRHYKANTCDFCKNSLCKN